MENDTLVWQPLEMQCTVCNSAVMFACVNGAENIAKWPRDDYVAKCTNNECVNNVIFAYGSPSPPDWCVRV